MSSLRPRTGALALVLAAVLAAPVAASASDRGASWQSAPAQAPPPPAGAQASPYPASLGHVGDIEFWSPNRGVLITAGNTLVPAGVYAYDGVSWHELSSVCGGHEGRIAWAREDEFWTISDQRPGQVTANEVNEAADWDVSLCRFALGPEGRLEVVGSYAMPLDEPDSYRPMDAAACAGPNDCWFGGELGPGLAGGAFHLYWDGTTLSTAYSPFDHAIAAMAVEGSQIYESVKLGSEDDYGSESQANPLLLHTIVASEPSELFHRVEPIAADCTSFCKPLPEYGSGSGGNPVAPDTLASLALSSDWSPSGDGPAAPQLWAVAGPDDTQPPAGQESAHPIVLRRSGSAWTQVVPNLVSFEAGEDPLGVAADPGEPAAWVAIESQDDRAHVDLISSPDGGETWTVSERDQLGPEQDVGLRGEAGPIACPAPHECWLATSQGWLFHLTDGIPPVPDTDPAFDGVEGVISHRPSDSGVPEVLPFAPAETEPVPVEPTPTTPQPAKAEEQSKAITKAKAGLVEHEHSRVVRRNVRSRSGNISEDVLELTFTLTAKAHVQLLASRHGKVVARTPKRTLRQGRHTLDLTLDPKRWPTKLSLKATAEG